ncbi:MAG: PDZ domain-containing protein [Chloroflexota bacterium]|nr:PDZ domain-containing protein [Dehalococcoidia bacterium]MDW8252358.1 PDZ domain-containing protein [Chloroflexota bacterium]
MPRSRRRSLKLLIPSALLFVLLCLVAPLLVGLGLRAQRGNEAPLGELGGGQAWVGIRMRPVTPEAAAVLGLPTTNGALIDRIYPTSPAEQSGLQQFDVIIQINGQPVATVDAVSGVFSGMRPGTPVSITVLRPDPSGRSAAQRREIALVTGTRPRIGEVRGWTDYRSANVPYQFRYPNTWFIDDVGAPAEPILIAPPTPYNDVVQFQVSANVPALDQWYRQVLESAREGAAEVRVENERSVTLANLPGRRASLTIIGSANLEQKVEFVLIRDSATSRGYFIFLSAHPVSYPDLLRNFEDILASFSIRG